MIAVRRRQGVAMDALQLPVASFTTSHKAHSPFFHRFDDICRLKGGGGMSDARNEKAVR
jgi:hypothetical protein